MAKGIFLVAFAVFTLALATSSAHAKEFKLKGSVYCDSCRTLFFNKLSTNPQGAEVALICKNRNTGVETFKTKAVTSVNGTYVIQVPADHEQDVCEVTAVRNPDPNCNQIVDVISHVKVSLADNSGMDTPVRYANPVGFVRLAPIPNCLEKLKELGYEFYNDVAVVQAQAPAPAIVEQPEAPGLDLHEAPEPQPEAHESSPEPEVEAKESSSEAHESPEGQE